MGYHDDFKEIIGKTLASVEQGHRVIGREPHTHELDTIEFHLEGVDEPVRYSAEGDCCSRSWIEHSDIPEVAGLSVVSVEETELENGDNKDGDYIQVYNTRFILSNGQMIVLEYRNSSNGYYGGYLTRCA